MRGKSRCYFPIWWILAQHGDDGETLLAHENTLKFLPISSPLFSEMHFNHFLVSPRYLQAIIDPKGFFFHSESGGNLINVQLSNWVRARKNTWHLQRGKWPQHFVLPWLFKSVLLCCPHSCLALPPPSEGRPNGQHGIMTLGPSVGELSSPCFSKERGLPWNL